MKQQRVEASEKRKSEKKEDQRRERKENEDQRRERVSRKNIQVRETVFSQCFFGSRGLKSRLAKAAGAEAFGEMRDEKVHAGVARSRFGSQNVQGTPCLEHFWKLRCAHHCGVKHMWKSKC